MGTRLTKFSNSTTDNNDKGLSLTKFFYFQQSDWLGEKNHPEEKNEPISIYSGNIDDERSKRDCRRMIIMLIFVALLFANRDGGGYASKFATF